MKNKIVNYQNDLIKVIKSIDLSSLEKVVELFVSARDNGNFIFTAGNGGSGSTASHMVCDILKGCSLGKEKRFKILCLNDNIPTILAYSNDLSYDVIFEEQLKNLFNKGDIFVAISGSGNSQNILNAASYVKNNGGIVIGFTGFSGGKLKLMSDVSIHAELDNMQIAEDFHVIIMHILYSVLQEY